MTTTATTTATIATLISPSGEVTSARKRPNVEPALGLSPSRNEIVLANNHEMTGNPLMAPCLETLPFRDRTSTLAMEACPQAVTMPPSSTTTSSFCYEEMRQVWRILSTINNRYVKMLNAHSLLSQDYGALQNHLGEMERELGVERQATGRAHDIIEQIRQLGINLTDRVNKLSQSKKFVEDKVLAMVSLAQSLRDIKNKLEDKIRQIEFQKESLENNLRETRAKNTIQVDEFEIKIKLLQDDIATKDKELITLRAQLQESQAQMGSLQVRIQEITNLQEQQRQDFEAKLENAESCRLELIKGIGKQLMGLAKKLGCHPPVNLGDGSIVAFANVFEEMGCELEQKQRNLIRDHEQETAEMRGNSETLNAQLEGLRSQLVERQFGKEELDSRNQKLHEEVMKQQSYITKLEGRIGEMQLEASKTALKLSELQNLKVLGNVVGEVLENQQGKMEYEDMKLILMEKLNHNDCNGKIQTLEEELRREKDQCAQLEETLEKLKHHVEEKEKAHQDELKSMTSQLDSVKKTFSSIPRESHEGNFKPTKKHPLDVARDNTIDGLIQLMEKDTQELKAMQSTRISINTVTSVNTPTNNSTTKRRTRATASAAAATAAVTGVTASAKRYRKRSPLPSNQSEADLWSVFRKP